MSRTTRALLCALCLLTLGAAAAPAFAQAPPPPGPFPLASLSPTIRLIQTVTVTGGGLTEDAAKEHAETKLEEDYIVLSILSTTSSCVEIELPSTDPFGNHDTVDLCMAEIRARVIRKAIIVVWP
jgi:hypothetical protein